MNTPTGTPAQQRETSRRIAVARLAASRLQLHTPASPARLFGTDIAAMAGWLAALVQGHPVASAAAAAGVGALFARLRPWRWLAVLGTLVGPTLMAAGTRPLAAWLATLQPGGSGATAADPQTSTRASKNA